MPIQHNSKDETMPTIPSLTAEVGRLSALVNWWNTAIVVMMIVAALAATGLVITQWIAFKRAEDLATVTGQLSDLKEADSKSRISAAGITAANAQKEAGESNKAAGAANERAGKANERAAKLEVEALSLRMELLRQGARENLLVGATRAKLVASLMPFAGQSVEVRYGLNTFGMLQHVPEPASPDVRGLANSLIAILNDAHWSIPPAPFISVLQGPEGMTVQISPKAPPSTVAAAKALVNALKDVPLTVQGPLPTELSAMPRQGTVNVFLPKIPGGPAVLTPMPDPTDETIVLSVLAHPK